MSDGKPAESLWSRIRHFLGHDAWTAELSSVTGLRSLVIRLLRVAQLVGRGFREDDLAVHAAALTFSTLVSLVPLLTLGFAMLKGFGGGEEASARLAESMAAMPPQFQEFVSSMIDIVLQANFRTLGWVGVAILFVTAVQVLGSIETSFNRVWGVKESRPLWRKFTNYISVTVVVPVLIMTAFAVSASLKNQVVAAHIGETAWLYRTLLGLTPLATVWFALFLLFVFMPNTQVSRQTAGASAFLTALLWLGWQRIYISMQVSLSRYDAVYGTFASVPIFLLWLYVSWMLILLGAEIAFALQHHVTYHMERVASQTSVRAKLTLVVAMVLDAARALRGGRPPLDVGAYAQTHRVPVRLLNDLAALLARGGLLAERADQPGCFLLLRDPSAIRVQDVLDLVLREGSMPDSLKEEQVEAAVAQAVRQFNGGLTQGLSGLTFTDLMEPVRTP
ncbi:MAG TPA: YihY/virulence factor BrkB family protein [Kiritimatiellia bacterium]|nr:YihY/virulence factor BrkB family protein [Kiritimatiellia bacterium]